MITSQELAFVRLAMRRRLVTANVVREAVERKKWDDPDRPLSSILVDMGALEGGEADRLRRALEGGERAEADRRARATMVAVDPNAREPGEEPRGEAPLEQVGKYKLVRLLGAGAMGAVYLAEHTELRRTVALKLLMSDGAPSPRAIARFRREARLAARLDHPNVVRVYEAGFEESQHYIAMDMVAGRSVAELIALSEVSPRRAVHITRKSAEAVDYAHEQGVIHRDLKPANILVDERTGEPRVTDFGLATMSEPDEDDRLTRTGAAVGTPAYMAPEQVRGQLDKIDARTDVYALGATLYEMLTGRPPFEADTFLDLAKKICDQEPIAPRKRNSRVPSDVETICLKALEKRPQDRYQSAAELAADLAAYLDDAPIVATPPSTFTVARRWARRRPAVVATLLALIGALCGGLTFHFTRPGTVQLYSRPAGATVKVDGVVVGQTSADAPLELVLPAGDHDLRFELSGYLELALGAESVDVGHGTTHTLTGTLISRQGTLRVVSDPPGAVVKVLDEAGAQVDGGRTHFLTSLDAGTYRVVVSEAPPGYVVQRPEQLAEVTAGGAPVKVELGLSPDLGVLHLETDPSPATFRDARGRSGVTPAEILGAGRHDLEVSRSGYITRAVAAEVPGQPVRERVSLAPAVDHRRLLEGRLLGPPLVDDLDGDGSAELVAIERVADGAELAVYPGGGQVGERFRVRCEADRLVAAVDLDLDGVLDLVLGTAERLELRDGSSGALLAPAVPVNAHAVAVDAERLELLFVGVDGRLVATSARDLPRRATQPNLAAEGPPAVFELRAEERVAAYPLADGTLRVQPVTGGDPRDVQVPGLRFKSRVYPVRVGRSRSAWVLAVPWIGPALLIDPQAGTAHTLGDAESRIVEVLSLQAAAHNWVLVTQAEGCTVYRVDAQGVERMPDPLPRRPRELEPGVVWTPSGQVFELVGRQRWIPVPQRSAESEALIDPDGPAVVADIDGDGAPEVVAATADRRALAVLGTRSDWLRWRAQLAAQAVQAVVFDEARGWVWLGTRARVLAFSARDGSTQVELETDADVTGLALLRAGAKPSQLAVSTHEHVAVYAPGEPTWTRRWQVPRTTPSLDSAGEDIDGDGIHDPLVGRPLSVLGSKDGKAIWTGDPSSAGLPLRGALRLGGERLLCVGAAGSTREPGLIARTPQGDELWRVPLTATRSPLRLLGDDDLDTVLVVTASATGIPYRHDLLALDRRDGEVRWHQERLPGQPATVQGLVVGGDEARVLLTLQTSPREHQLVCLDAGTGIVLWAHVLPRADNSRAAPSRPARLIGQAGRRSDDTIAVVAPSGALLFYGLSDGRLLGERRVDEGFAPLLGVAPAPAEALLATSEQGRLLAISVRGPEGRRPPTRRERLREQRRVLNLGREALQRAALNELTTLLDERPRDPVATLALAQAYLGQGRWKEARQHAESADKLLAEALPTRVADCLAIVIRARFEESNRVSAIRDDLEALAGLDPLRAAATATALIQRVEEAGAEDTRAEQQLAALRASAVTYLQDATARSADGALARARLGELQLTWPGFEQLDWRRPEPEIFVRGRAQASAARVELLLALQLRDDPRTRAAAILALCLERRLTALFGGQARTPAHVEAEKNRLDLLDRLLGALLETRPHPLVDLVVEVGRATLAEQPLPRTTLRQLANGRRGLVPEWRVAVDVLERSGSR